MDWTSWALQQGVSFALVFGALVYFFREWVVPASRVEKLEKQCATEVERLEKVRAEALSNLEKAKNAEITQLRQAYEMVLVELRAHNAKIEEEKDEYKEVLFTQAKVLTKQQETLARQQEMVERVTSALPSPHEKPQP
jgi:hypothetical protein